MKFKTTQKAIKGSYSRIISIPYCAAQYLLRFENPIAYTSGVYGWDADLYDVDDVAIVTGYRPFGNIRPDYETIRRYEHQAQVIANGSGDLDSKRERVTALLHEFIASVIA